MLSPLDALPYLLTAAAILCFYAAARFLRRNRPKPRKHVTIVDPLSPSPTERDLLRSGSWCPSCARRVEHPRNERYQSCPVCGTALAHVSLVADAQPTDEPPTVPDGGPRAA